jgi:hypothetical protein
LGPIFPDGTFEYVPIPERKRTRNHRSYATLLGRHGVPLADYLPRKLAQAHPHIDPDFRAATYGDAAPRKCRQLNKLIPHDILVFYCGLTPYPPDGMPRLFAIGYFRVKAVHRVSARDGEARRKLQYRFGNTAHFVLRVPDRELVLVEGYRTRSRLRNTRSSLAALSSLAATHGILPHIVLKYVSYFNCSRPKKQPGTETCTSSEHEPLLPMHYPPKVVRSPTAHVLTQAIQ